MTGRRALIVEDEILIRLTLVEALGDEGFELTEAGSADEGLAILRGPHRFVLLVTDIQLPGTMNGLDLAAAARAMDPALAIIFMTGRPDVLAGRVASAREAFVTKPSLPADIAAIARRLVGPTA